MKILVLLNPSAGTLARSASHDEPQTIAREFASLNIDCTIETPDVTDLLSHARAAAQSKQYDAIIAGGGDGTLNTVANALIDTGVPFGVLPLGTHNHFAKDLNIPLTLPEAIQTLARATPQPLPVADLNGEIFLNFSAIGFHPEIIRHRDAQRRTLGRTKWFAMAIASLRTLVRFPLMRVRLTTPDQTFVRNTPSVILCNNPHQMRVFGVENASIPDRRLLNVYVAQRTRRLGILWLFIRAMFRILDKTNTFDVLTVPKISLSRRHRTLRVSLDGELRDLPPPLNYTIRETALIVLMPASTPSPPG